MQLALMGEKLNRRGNKRKAIPYFSKALKLDSAMHAMCAVHSQLGNCYFGICEYERAVLHHKRDLQDARRSKDR